MPQLHSNRESHPDGTTTNVTKDGQTVRTADPSARPDAGLGQKLAGDAKGGVAKATGSLQAAAGAATGNEKLKQQGLDKMQGEDQRLAAKHGQMPLGSSLREKASGQHTAEQVPAATTHATTQHTTGSHAATGAADDTATTAHNTHANTNAGTAGVPQHTVPDGGHATTGHTQV
ncbi:hypothetical protein PG999_001653 [Apiospora kogelbergensis]|uniref:MT0933-like antitoxin protein n=1 Tax=Apiospora kogelbergensis TaxID=1337665 RepID=A0AAW0R671_9PEZI